MRSKGKIFTRHGTTDIGLNIVNAKKANTYESMVAMQGNLNSANDGKFKEAALAVA